LEDCRVCLVDKRKEGRNDWDREICVFGLGWVDGGSGS